MGNFFSDLFDTGGDLEVAADPYGGARTKLLKYLTGSPTDPSDMGLIGKPGPKYPGKKTASLSDAEMKSLNFLDQYGGTQYGSTMGAAKKEIEKTLGGDYDPVNSPYYQSVKAEAERNLDKTNKAIASNSAGAGRYYTGARMKGQREASTDVYNNLNTVLGGIAQTERQNRLNVLPQAQELAKTEANLPLQKATAFQSLGALPRNVEQADINATIEDWLRSEYQYPQNMLNLIAGIQTPPTYRESAPGAGAQAVSGISQGIGQLLPLLAFL